MIRGLSLSLSLSLSASPAQVDSEFVVYVCGVVLPFFFLKKKKEIRKLNIGGVFCSTFLCRFPADECLFVVLV